MARAGKASTAATPSTAVDVERASASSSPSTSTSPIPSDMPSSSPSAATAHSDNKKRKRTDDLKSLKRSKLKQRRASSTSAQDDSTVKVEDEDDEDPIDDIVQGPSLDPADAQRLLVVLEKANVHNALDTPHTIRSVPSTTTTTLRQLISPSSLSLPLAVLRERIRLCAPKAASDPHPHRTANTPSSRSLAAKADAALVKFYKLALQLVDDVAETYARSAYGEEPVLPAPPLPARIVDGGEDAMDVDGGDNTAAPIASTSKETAARKSLTAKPSYALYQHLPTGDYFTSAAPLSRAELKALPKGQAAFIEIHPAPSLPPSTLPTLSTYATSPHPIVPNSSSSTNPNSVNPNPLLRRPPPGPRSALLPKPPLSNPSYQLSAAAFLDYGALNASLAPSWDSEGGVVGRETLGLVGAWRRERAKRRAAARDEAMRIGKEASKVLELSSSDDVSEDSLAKMGDLSIIDPALAPRHPVPATYVEEREAMLAVASSLFANDPVPKPESLASAETGTNPASTAEVNAVLETFDTAYLSDQVSVLLRRNARALRRLQELQGIRFRAGVSTASATGATRAASKENRDVVPKESRLVEGSEEWVLGSMVQSSLGTVVGMRPRVASSSSPSSLVPSTKSLHSLQGSVPHGSSSSAQPQVWRGTLNPARDFALADNATIRPSSAALSLPPPPMQGSITTSATTSTGLGGLPPTPGMSAARYPNASTGGVGSAGGGVGGRPAPVTPRTTAPNASYYSANAYQYGAAPSTPTPNSAAVPTTNGGGTPYTRGGGAIPNLARPSTPGTPVTGAGGATPSSYMNNFSFGTGGITGGLGGIGGIGGMGMALPPHLRTGGGGLGALGGGGGGRGAPYPYPTSAGGMKPGGVGVGVNGGAGAGGGGWGSPGPGAGTSGASTPLR
ncbi:hypothetical protein DL93DRAFT_2173650 [Clavulina sp. PMI_390]|nr:hypothetical protein DL93DRAFT_2173650 [Clavulina sp. PMI_390]